MRIVPTAEVDDGLADVLVIGDSSRWALIASMREVCAGTHLDRPDVQVRRGRHVELALDRPVPVYADGIAFVRPSRPSRAASPTSTSTGRAGHAPGEPAYGRRMPRARRTLPTARLAAVLTTPALLLACATGAPAVPAATTTAPTTTPPDPVLACAAQLTYWAGQDLAGVPGEAYDYQHRGLTSEQNDALAVLEEQARTQGWSPGQLDERARAACVPIVAAEPNGY